MPMGGCWLRLGLATAGLWGSVHAWDTWLLHNVDCDSCATSELVAMVEAPKNDGHSTVALFANMGDISLISEFDTHTDTFPHGVCAHRPVCS